MNGGTKMRKITLFLITLLVLCVAVSAHSGKTDINGGHYDRSTGEYHFHHGFPAHQHTDGICPYDFVDQTDTGTSVNGTKKSESTVPVQKESGETEQEVMEVGESEKKLSAGGKIALLAWGVLFLIYPAALFSWMVIQGIIASLKNFGKKRLPQSPKELQAPLNLPRPDSKNSIIQEDEDLKYAKLLEGKSIWELAGVPGWAYFDQNDFPHSLPDCLKGPDPFIVYATKDGDCYHRPGCRMSRNAEPINICVAQNLGKRPCKVCKPMDQLPDFVKQYRQIRKTQRAYKIKMLP